MEINSFFKTINKKPGAAAIDLTTGFFEQEMQFDEFEILYFFDFCSTLDACVLHENIYTIDKPSNEERYLDNSLSSLLYKEGAISVIGLGDDLNDYINNHPVSLSLLKASPSNFDLSELDLWTDGLGNIIRACNFAVLEQDANITYIPNFHVTPAYLYADVIKREQAFANEIYSKLNERYKDFQNDLFGLRKLLDGNNFIQVPPISFEILKKADSFKDIPEVMMETRKRYSPLRKRFIELEELLISNDVSLKKKLKEKQKLFKAINYFTEQLKSESTFIMTSIATEVNDKIDAGKLIEGAGAIKGIEWTKLIDFVIKNAEKLFLKFKLRPLYATKKQYMNANPKEISQSVEKHFGRALNSNDFSMLDIYPMFIKKGIGEVSS